ncbi:MAG TPA: motility protein A [Oscillospiraceae bacterium]|nr:motility protein A [Oscillospiraceae bacterium]
MNISGLIGLLAAVGLVIFGMLDGGEARNFLEPASIAITVGGTIGALLISIPWSVVKKTPKLIALAFFPPKYKPREKINLIVDYAKIARSKGLLALEDSANNCPDPFMKSSLMLIVDANDAEKVRKMLDDALDFTDERHSQNREFFDRGAQLAPAFGMLGTLIGLINMLADLDSNPDNLGQGMAVALITTFYGSFLANIIFSPVSSRLKALHEEEMLCMNITVEGVLAIQSGANPRNIEEKLEFMLSQKELNSKKHKNRASD